MRNPKPEPPTPNKVVPLRPVFMPPAQKPSGDRKVSRAVIVTTADACLTDDALRFPQSENDPPPRE
jgi:hypothetical protein